MKFAIVLLIGIVAFALAQDEHVALPEEPTILPDIRLPLLCRPRFCSGYKTWNRFLCRCECSVQRPQPCYWFGSSWSWAACDCISRRFPVFPPYYTVGPTLEPIDPTIGPIPIDPTTGPIDPTIQPVDPTVQPIDTTDQPTETTDKPTEPTIDTSAPIEETTPVVAAAIAEES